MRHIEDAAEELRATGACKAWSKDADPQVCKVCTLRLKHVPSLPGHVSQVASQVNGLLLELLAEACNYHDKDAIEIFRQGGKLASDAYVSLWRCLLLWSRA